MRLKTSLNAKTSANFIKLNIFRRNLHNHNGNEELCFKFYFSFDRALVLVFRDLLQAQLFIWEVILCGNNSPIFANDPHKLPSKSIKSFTSFIENAYFFFNHCNIVNVCNS